LPDTTAETNENIKKDYELESIIHMLIKLIKTREG
jgi:hypothetical protein